MEEYIYYNNLYDCYSKLLTDKQRNYFEDYYFSNFSLSEIADSYNVSRNAVYKQLKIVKLKLEEYEDKLKLYEKKENLLIYLKQIDNKGIKEKIESIID